MPQKIHYRDDIFLLSMIVKTLDAGITVEADPEYYRDRVVADMFFIDATVRSLSEILSKNLHLVARSEYLRLLEGVAVGFLRALEKLGNGESPQAEHYGAYTPQIRTLIAGQKSVVLSLRSLLENDGATPTFDAELVSGDELERLLGE